MAQGILHADRVNTVSDTYAKEILTPEYGAGLDPLLARARTRVSGIVNGIDYEEFNPATDPALARNFDADTLDERAENKRALQAKAGLPVRDDAMLFAVVTRLFAQKGIDLVATAFDSMLATHDAQLVVLGTGDEDVQRMLLQLQQKYPEKVKIWLDFNPPLGQQIYAGCDGFLMPSRYEPCGLGQLISLRYGAVPLVRRTGGLADTVAGRRPGASVRHRLRLRCRYRARSRARVRARARRLREPRRRGARCRSAACGRTGRGAAPRASTSISTRPRRRPHAAPEDGRA